MTSFQERLLKILMGGEGACRLRRKSPVDREKLMIGRGNRIAGIMFLVQWASTGFGRGWGHGQCV